nr:MAG TPA: hypothetical protein [Caudoviricetes sp.]
MKTQPSKERSQSYLNIIGGGLLLASLWSRR